MADSNIALNRNSNRHVHRPCEANIEDGVRHIADSEVERIAGQALISNTCRVTSNKDDVKAS